MLRLMIVASSSRAGGTKSVRTHYSEDFWGLPYEPNLNFTDNEKIVTSDFVKYILPYFDSILSPVSDNTAEPDSLLDFGNLYCQRINVVYEKDDERYMPAFYYEGENYFIYVLDYTNTNPSFRQIISKDDLDALLNFNAGSYIVRRTVRIYKEKRIIMIKPKQIRFWMKSIALKDADDTFNDILNTWYNE